MYKTTEDIYMYVQFAGFEINFFAQEPVGD